MSRHLNSRLAKIEAKGGDRTPLIVVGDAPEPADVGNRPVIRVRTGVPRATPSPIPGRTSGKAAAEECAK